MLEQFEQFVVVDHVSGSMAARSHNASRSHFVLAVAVTVMVVVKLCLL